MKRCPYCAEEIQDAAIVCKHCHRDLAQRAPAAPKTQSRAIPLVLLVVLIGAAGFCGFYLWGTSAYGYDLEGARNVIAGMEKEGGITERSCRPNRTVMVNSYWQSIPGDSRKEKVLALLTRICIAEGGDPQMTLVNERGIELATFNVWSMRRADR